MNQVNIQLAMNVIEHHGLLFGYYINFTAVDTSNQAWQQAELSLLRGGFGMRSLSAGIHQQYILPVWAPLALVKVI